MIEVDGVLLGTSPGWCGGLRCHNPPSVRVIGLATSVAVLQPLLRGVPHVVPFTPAPAEERFERALTCPRMRFAVLAWIARDLHRQMLLYDQATIYRADYRQEYAPGPYIRSMPVYEPWHRYFKARYGHAKVGDESSLGLTEYYDKLAAILMSAAVQHGAQ